MQADRAQVAACPRTSVQTDCSEAFPRNPGSARPLLADASSEVPPRPALRRARPALRSTNRETSSAASRAVTAILLWHGCLPSGKQAKNEAFGWLLRIFP